MTSITDTAIACARTARGRGLTPESYIFGLEFGADDADALEQAAGRRLNQEEWDAARAAFEQEIREPTPAPEPLAAEPDDAPCGTCPCQIECACGDVEECPAEEPEPANLLRIVFDANEDHDAENVSLVAWNPETGEQHELCSAPYAPPAGQEQWVEAETVLALARQLDPTIVAVLCDDGLGWGLYSERLAVDSAARGYYGEDLYAEVPEPEEPDDGAPWAIVYGDGMMVHAVGLSRSAAREQAELLRASGDGYGDEEAVPESDLDDAAV